MVSIFDLFRRRDPKQIIAESLVARINQLELNVEQLQLQSAERHIAVLNAVEKVLHQLHARTRKREAETPSQDDLQDQIALEASPYHPPLRGPNRKMRPW